MHRALLLTSVLFLAAAPAGAQQPITVGQTTAGELSGSDRKEAEGRIFDAWRFTARAGAVYMVTLRSQEFDAYLWAGPARGDDCDPCQRSDDFTDNDSRVVLEAETGGPQVIRASTYRAGETGRYTLVVDEVEPLPPSGAAPSPASRGGGALRPGVAATGVLDEGDRRAPYNQRQKNSLYDVWTYRGTAGEPLVISLRSDDFDTFLRVYQWDAGRWQLLASNDDEAGGETNSKVTVTLPADGEYQVHAAAFREEATGAYTLAVVGGVATDTVVVTTTPGDLPILPPGGSRDGELAAADRVGEDGAFYDAYRYFASAGETAVFELRSEEFDAVLRIGIGEGGAWREVASDDDGGRGTHSELTYTFPARAEYELRAGTIAPDATGAYSLFATTSIHDDITAGLPEGTVVPGQTHAGRLESGDPRGETGAYEDVWTTSGGGRVTIDLRSNDFDPSLSVSAQQPDGSWRLVASDDDGGVGTDSRLVVDLPSAGRYRIHVTAYRARESGQYRLSVHH